MQQVCEMSHMWEWHLLALYGVHTKLAAKSVNWTDSAQIIFTQTLSKPFPVKSSWWTCCDYFLVTSCSAWLKMSEATKCLVALMVETLANNLEEICSSPVEDLVKCQTANPTKNVERCGYPSVLNWFECIGGDFWGPEECVRTFAFAAERGRRPWHSALSAYTQSSNETHAVQFAILPFCVQSGWNATVTTQFCAMH